MDGRLAAVAINKRAGDPKQKARNGIRPFLAQFHHPITTPTLNKTNFILFLKLSQALYLTILKSCLEIGREYRGFLTGWVVSSTIERRQMAGLWGTDNHPTRYVTSDFINSDTRINPRNSLFSKLIPIGKPEVPCDFPCNSVC